MLAYEQPWMAFVLPQLFALSVMILMNNDQGSLNYNVVEGVQNKQSVASSSTTGAALLKSHSAQDRG